MVKYFLIKFKSLLKILPYLFIAIVVLFACMIAAFNTALDATKSGPTVRFRLALVCSDDDPYFKAGLDIVQAYDSSRFSIEALQMDEPQAQTALQKGELDAYVVIPKGYIGAAMDGELGSLKYVSTSGAAELTALFKDEITGVIADIIIACEKGMYGIDQIADAHGFSDKAGSYMNQISLKYVDFLLERSDMYYVDELGIHDSLGLDGYLFSGITVLILSVMLMPASVGYIGQDMAVQHLLKSKNIGAGKQVSGEYMALISVILVPVTVVFCSASVLKPLLIPELQRLLGIFSIHNILSFLVITLVMGAFAYLMFQLADDFVGGILLYFFVTLGMCFISGCIYPIYFFPDNVRNVAQYMPHGVCRSVISQCILGQRHYRDLTVLLLYSCVMLFAAYLIRKLRLRASMR